jgi:hypothetical protein
LRRSEDDAVGLCGCRNREPAVADKNALGVIGLMLCAATVLVTMVGAIVVNDHLSGRLHIEDNWPIAAVALPTAAR